jgi:hypothetical protein
MRTLKLGSTGRDVKAWQEFLAAQNLAPGNADGFFGANTRSATSIFQTQHGLPSDGLVGRGTVAAAVGKGFIVPPEEQIGGALGGNDDFVAEIAGVTVFETEGGEAIYYTAGLAVDADGAYRAYKIRNKGLDLDDNGKSPAKPSGKWVGVVTDGNGDPVVQKAGDPAPGFLVSTTSLQDRTRARTDPLRYVDSEKVPYIVLPGGVLGRAGLGDYAIIVNTRTGKLAHAIAADAGPRAKIGEASMAAARTLLGDDEKFWSPRSGGTDEKIMRYIVFPGSRDDRFPSSHPDLPGLLEGTIAHLSTRAATLLAALPAAHQTALTTGSGAV